MTKDEITAAIQRHMDEISIHKNEISKLKRRLLVADKESPSLVASRFSFGMDILKMRHEGMTLKAIGLKYGLSSERVRQIEAKTVQHLRKLNGGGDVLVNILSARAANAIKAEYGFTKLSELLSAYKSSVFTLESFSRAPNVGKVVLAEVAELIRHHTE